MKKLLKVDIDFNPCPADIGDELYPNGIFEFNITKMLEHIQRTPVGIAVEDVTVCDFPRDFSSINESHVDSTDISITVILAEISPGRYNLIDGNHRMEKARRTGVKNLVAYKLSVEQHMPFLTSKKAYLAYIEYWNSKLRNWESRDREFLIFDFWNTGYDFFELLDVCYPIDGQENSLKGNNKQLNELAK
jgi:hypothetical protein